MKPITALFAAGLLLAPTMARAQGPGLPAAGDGPRDSAAAASTAAAPPLVVRNGSGMTLHAVSLSEPLTIDGRLEEALYRTVAPVSDFVQVEPQEGAPASERTEMWIAFDEDRVYVSFRCFESDPARLVAKEMRRDNPGIWSGDDNIAFIFDTFNDKRNGFQFTLNSIGGRQDAQIANERQWGGDWNTIWDFSVKRFDGGWTVETAIPFKSLRYNPGAEQVWGFNAFRTNRWKNELSFLKPTTKAMGQRGLLQTSMAVPLRGLKAPSESRTLEIKPYAISNANSALDTNGSLVHDAGGDLGVDAKYGVTRNLTADLTYRTDFAQVEADQQQVNLTRFSLFFPEKREFFLENQGTFLFGTTQINAIGDAPIMFYSRRIGLEGNREVPLEGGGRLTGRVGPFTVGALNIQTRDEPVGATPRTGFSVVRVRRDLFRRSSVGAIFTGRDEHGGPDRSNHVMGVDAMFAFFANLGINTYWAQTRGDGLGDGNTSYRTQLDYAGDRYGVQLDRLVIGEHFRPGIGYVRRDDIAQSFGLFRFSPRPQGSKRIRKYAMSGSLKYTEDTHGRLETRDQWTEFAVEFQNGDRFNVANNWIYEFLPEPFRVAGSPVVLPVGPYDFDNVQIGFTRGPQQRISGALVAEHGTFYNGHKSALSLNSGRVAVTPQLSAEPTYSVNWVDLIEGSFTTQLAGARITYTPTALMFASALVQYNSSLHAVSANVRLRWEYQPGSELFIVYNEERDTLGRRFADLSNRAFIVKINRLFRF